MVLVSKNEKNHGKKKLLQDKENQEMSSIAKTFKPLLLVSSLFLSPYVIASYPFSPPNVQYDSEKKDTITLNKNGTKLTNLKDADLNDTSKDAVTGKQLFKTNQNVASLEQSAVKYDDPKNKDTITLKGEQGTKLTNLQEADLNDTSTDAVTGKQLFKTNQNVADLDQSAVKYDSKDKDSITLGKTGTAVKLTNLQDGKLREGSSDAVTGGQLYKTNQKVGDLDQSAVKYDSQDKNSITLGQRDRFGRPGTKVTLTNLQDGKLREGSSDAVTGGQLYKTNQKVAGLDTKITDFEAKQDTLSQLAVQYDSKKQKTITLQGKNGTKLTNLKDADLTKESTDAVTGKQLFETNQSFLQTAKGLQDNITSFLGGGANYIDGKFTGPTYVIQGVERKNIGATFELVDQELKTLNQYVGRLGEDGSISTITSLRTYIDTELTSTKQYTKDQILDALKSAKNYTDQIVTGLSNSASGTGVNSTQMGPNSLASGDNSTAVGTGNNVSGNSSTAVGVGNNVSGNNSGAFGDPNTVTGNGSYAVGNDNTVSGDNTFVLGNNVNTSATNSVVLGNDSASTRDNTVSVGASGSERQIINVADATQETDAVNLRQMQAANTETLKSSKDYTDTRINSLESSFADLSSQMDRRFKEVDKRFDRQGAMSAAMMNMAASTAGLKGLNRVGVAAGFQGSEKAVAIGYQRIVNENISLSIGGAFTDDEGSGGAGVGFSW